MPNCKLLALTNTCLQFNPFEPHNPIRLQLLCVMKKLLLILIVLHASGLSFGQSIGTTLDETLFTAQRIEEPVISISSSFFVENRERLRDTMPDSSMVVLFSAPQKTKSNDIDYEYHQDPNFYYFTGIREPNAMILILKNPMRIDEKWYREILFVEEKNDKKERWTGKMLGLEKAQAQSGSAAVMSNTEWKSLPINFEKIETIYTNSFLDIERDDKMDPGDLKSLVTHTKAKVSFAKRSLSTDAGLDIFAYLRQSKTEEEIKVIEHAADITCEAQNQIMRHVKPGMKEYEIEAMIEYIFRSNGAEGEAFPSIVASGENGSIMHYTANDATLNDGEMMVVDIGAQYHGYSADITRTIPISGVFSEEQKQIYQLVLDAQTVGIRYATRGYKFWTPHEEAFRTVGKGLIKLGIIQEWKQIDQYYIHGTSHYLGLDVHDPGVYSSLQPGEVMTVEPGIYIPKDSPCDPKWWDIYVRIEDDILITNGRAKILSDKSPRTIQEIEEFMSGTQPVEESN